VLLAIIIISSWAGTAGVVVSLATLQGHWLSGHLFMAAGLVAYSVAGVAAVLMRYPKEKRQSGGRSWLGLPRLAWVVMGLGLLLALSEVVAAVTPSLGASPSG
jgi:hypothetical protein